VADGDDVALDMGCEAALHAPANTVAIAMNATTRT